MGLTSGYGTQARGHMDPEVACRCQLLHRQVTGAAGVAAGATAAAGAGPEVG